MSLRPRLSTILLLINLVILALPLGGIIWLRLYESALVRQTESELIAQGAIIASFYRSAFERQAEGAARGRRGRAEPSAYGAPLTATRKPPSDGPWQPRLAVLDLATDPILPEPEEAAPAAEPAEPLARAVGEELTPVLRNAQRTTLAGIRVVDFRGTVVASTSEDFGRSLVHLAEIRRALAGESVSLMRWRGGERPAPPLESISRGTRIRVHVAVPIVRDERVLGAVLLVRTPGNIRQAIYGKRVPLAWAALVLLTVVAVLSVLTSLTISRPVQNVIDQARRAARGEKGAVIPLRRPGTREIAELSDTVAAMARTLEARADYIRNFAAHVSHEFKTPLTAIQGAVELLRDHADSMSAEERARFLGILSSDARRLEDLVRRLLELARADMMQVEDARADAGRVLEGVAARYRELGLRVELAGGAPQATVAMGPETLDSVLSNLLDNARQHGEATEVVVQCVLEPAPAAPMLAITVSDNGHGISPANAERVFEPFFTTARTAGNTGLGLPIIRALIAAHRGTIERVPVDKGARFRIRLPLAAPPAPTRPA